MMFIIGTGMEYLPGVPFSSAMCAYSGRPLDAAAALAFARETAEIAFAPKLDLFQYRPVDHDLVDASLIFSIFARIA